MLVLIRHSSGQLLLNLVFFHHASLISTSWIYLFTPNGYVMMILLFCEDGSKMETIVQMTLIIKVSVSEMFCVAH